MSISFSAISPVIANGENPGRLWLIGLLFEGDLRQFLYPKEEKDFLDYILENGITSLVSWTRYDHKALKPLLEGAGIKMKFIDACQRTSNCLTWHTYSLHELYNALFPEKQTIDFIPGHIAGLYADHIIIRRRNCEYCPSRKELIKKIKERNKADLLQMVGICRKLWDCNCPLQNPVK